MAGGLSENGPDEIAVADEIAAPESCGVRAKPKEPLHAAVLHPAGRAAHLAGENVECGTDADGEFDGENGEILLDPVLLFWSAETNEEDGGVGGLDSSENGSGQFGRFFEPRGRAVDASDAKPRKAHFEMSGRALRSADVAAEQVH